MKAIPDWTQEKGRVAIVHDWLTGMRGGEAILDAICELFPNADLYTLLWTDKKMSPAILNGRTVHSSWLQRLMCFRSFREGYRKLLPFFPLAASSLDLRRYDLVISNSHCVVKGVSQLHPKAVHISYISTPMRYVWDMFYEYFGPGRAGLFTRIVITLLRKPLQYWDKHSNARVQHFLANSRFVQGRIERFWGRSSTVLHPFVELSRFAPPATVLSAGQYYLVVSALAPYKRIDMAIAVFKKLGLPLKILGKGQDLKKLQQLARGANNIEFLGGLDNEAVVELYRGAKALVFPGVEDFGITPLECMACGRPVIALAKGGLLDTVTPETGILYRDYSLAGLEAAVRDFESGRQQFSPAKCRARAEEFTREHFVKGFVQELGTLLEGRK